MQSPEQMLPLVRVSWIYPQLHYVRLKALVLKKMVMQPNGSTNFLMIEHENVAKGLNLSSLLVAWLGSATFSCQSKHFIL